MELTKEEILVIARILGNHVTNTNSYEKLDSLYMKFYEKVKDNWLVDVPFHSSINHPYGERPMLALDHF